MQRKMREKYYASLKVGGWKKKKTNKTSFFT